MEINKPVSIMITLVVSLFIIYLFVLPKYQESRSLEVELVNKQAQYEGRVDYYVKLSDTLEELEQKQDVLNKIESALPSNFAIAPVVYFLQEKAKEAKLEVKSISFSRQQPYRQVSSEDSNQKIKNVMFRADLTGSYQSLKNFIFYLEKSTRIFEVNSISFTGGQVSDSKLSKNILQEYDFALEIETHTY